MGPPTAPIPAPAQGVVPGGLTTMDADQSGDVSTFRTFPLPRARAHCEVKRP